MSAAQTVAERRSLERYLKSMKCKACAGKGCRECDGSGDSPKFKRLIFRATKGMRK